MTKGRLASLIILIVLGTTISHSKESVIWSLGEKDGTPGEFALAPDGFTDFLAKDFGYEDKYYVIGHSRVSADCPYVLPGPVDTWGGTWPTAGWRTHQLNILFDLAKAPAKGKYTLNIDLVDFSKQFLPVIKVTVNDVDHEIRLTSDKAEESNSRHPSQTEKTSDAPALKGDYSDATPYSITIPVASSTLKAGNNEVTIAPVGGSWIMFDRIALTGTSKLDLAKPQDIYVRGVEAARYAIGGNQILLVDVEHLSGTPDIEVELDSKKIFSAPVAVGRYQFEVPMPAVNTPTTSTYKITSGGHAIARGKVTRTPGLPEITLADYVDTRIGTGHSRWMIAPGPWMPFGMVKLSPDNQNSGWQAGYQPTMETIGCFSHIHEWTLGGLGIMATNGPLVTQVGDELKPDSGYRSRLDKRTEIADIGYYAADLADYDIKAEITATTRCGMERFTFPADRGNGRILIDLKPQSEYGFNLKDIKVTKVSDTRLEGYSHQVAPGVWSNDADQDYTVNFIVEFDRPMLRLGSWVNDDVTDDITTLEAAECQHAGLFAMFDTDVNPIVTVRTAISPVSIANAAENLDTEIITPFGWNFNAVRQNQVDTWNDLFARVDVKSNDRIEKRRFYNNMYRALCSRNIWSDVNGEWISTDGQLRRVNDPTKDVMIGCDAFWNTFWNLNQMWNLIAPEWSSRWVGSQLAMYDANGWLAKGPAGLNYVPVMVAEHEIPLIVSAWQMGIRDFDGPKALEAVVKMQTTPASKVFNGFAGNRDLVPYIEHHYVPHDKGRFSNTMEYSFDDWTVGQLAKALGNDSLYNVFNERGYWWKNVISDEGYCHMRDSRGEWFPDFDPFRSGANHHYVEGNAWQLTFFVPQDVPALVEKIGKQRFTDRLLWGFNQDEAWRYNAPNDQYWDHPVVQGNQQSMHFAYLFNYAGQPWNTQRWSRSILDRYYGSQFANAYLGDEDQGQMSAWAVMTSLGLFQMDGGTAVEPMYEIGCPVFEEATINLGGRYGRGDKFVIKANNASRTNIYVQSATLNGKPLNSFRFPAAELLGGGILELQMGPQPNTAWGIE